MRRNRVWKSWTFMNRLVISLLSLAVLVAAAGCVSVQEWWKKISPEKEEPAPTPEPTPTPEPEPKEEPAPDPSFIEPEPNSGRVPEELTGHYEGDFCVFDGWRGVKRPVMFYPSKADADAGQNASGLGAVLKGRLNVPKSLVGQRTLHIVFVTHDGIKPVYRAVKLR